ncbi:putative glycolipid-binding domain-containing protein [Paractinoplanes lichenicola]|uniref:Glycolipid-binding domain-containing protein n=1 Tax=Paractinoplanes lichenicola TaxID=2802976 RepID=A0ABS1W2E1_9ACTN|nr:putative glycolipid-binding domain-containing protein [Actinoplanes lichenicola]MBL7260897.1 putative glycolipid-binding domain-containing protein [Actinoplanes lichenicola]
MLPSSLFWQRKDTAGSEHVLTDSTDGLYAQGTALAVDPIPYTCRYELRTGPDWATGFFDVSAEGAGWSRGVRLELAAGRWRVTTAERGHLDKVLSTAGHAGAGLPGTEDPDLLYGAFDVDLGGSPLTNTLPIRRLGLHRAVGADIGVAHRISVAWVLLPSLEVVQSDQIYTALGDGRVRFANETFSADLSIDEDGFVVDYPGLAARVGDPGPRRAG